PKVDGPWCADANEVLEALLAAPAGGPWPEWVEYCRSIVKGFPVEDPANTTRPGYVSPFRVALELSGLCTERDLIIPCSSGGAFTVMMQAFRQKPGQRMITNKGLASMGYGLRGAIGAAIAGAG